jgi:hypothetical protein
VMAEDRAPTHYRFGPLERRGLIAGWRGGQIAAVTTGLIVAVFLLRSRPSGVGVILAFMALAVGVAVAVWPIGGRTVEEWAPDAARHVDNLRLQRRARRNRPFDSLRFLGVDLTPSGVVRGDPGDLRGERPSGTRAGVILDTSRQTYTAVLAVSAPGFVLMGAEDKSRRVSAWSGVLGSLAREGGALHRVQWIERSLPDDGATVRAYATQNAALGIESGPGRSYADLVEGEVGAVHRHEVLVSVTVHAGRARRAVRTAGGGRRGACGLVLREAATLARRLRDAGFHADGILDPDTLADVVRRALAAGTPGRGRPVEGWPGPMASQIEWGRIRTDDMWHATYWIAEWPRTEVTADFLGPLLLVADIRRSVSVVMEPVDARKAAQRIESARTADIADAELRRRGGFLATARRRREEEVLAQREVELADGHASFRFSGYVTVSALDPDGLEDACGRVEQAAGQAGLELRRCYGDQAQAFTCTLPLGRGLA